jgi:dienelactone hydrolase
MKLLRAMGVSYVREAHDCYGILCGTSVKQLGLALDGKNDGFRLMRSACTFVLAFTLALMGGGTGHSLRAPIAPQTVEFLSGNLHLKAFLWKPNGPGPFPAVVFNHGSGGPDATHTAGIPITQAAERLAPVFVKHGYAFFFPFRRGQGLSADQAPFIQDVLQREEAEKGKEAREHLKFVLMTTEQLDDVLAALAFLRTLPDIDRHRVAVSGHSFGGQLTLLAAERDAGARATVTFAAAAESWERSPELRERLLTAVRNATAPILFIQAANDYSTAASRDLAAELERLRKPYLVKVYPPVGKSAEDGHNLIYTDISLWEDDVLTFLEEGLTR